MDGRDENTTATIDARGLLCPLPVLKLRKRLAAMAPGTKVMLLADDPAAVIDVPHFCTESGHEFIRVDDAPDHQIYHVRRKGA